MISTKRLLAVAIAVGGTVSASAFAGRDGAQTYQTEKAARANDKQSAQPGTGWTNR